MVSLDAEKGAGGTSESTSPAGTETTQPIETGDKVNAVPSKASDFSFIPNVPEKLCHEPSVARYTVEDYEPPVVVHRLKRRGLFGQLTLLAEIEKPKTYPRNRKWFITFIVAVAGAAAPMGSSIFFRT